MTNNNYPEELEFLAHMQDRGDAAPAGPWALVFAVMMLVVVIGVIVAALWGLL